jgi:hypothetical protein
MDLMIQPEREWKPRQVPHKARLIPELGIQWHDTRNVPPYTVQVVTNNAHAICNGRRMPSDALQWHIIDAACRQPSTKMRHDVVRGRICSLGFAEVAESRHSGIRNANHRLRWAVLPLEGHPILGQDLG